MVSIGTLMYGAYASPYHLDYVLKCSIIIIIITYSKEHASSRRRTCKTKKTWPWTGNFEIKYAVYGTLKLYMVPWNYTVWCQSYVAIGLLRLLVVIMVILVLLLLFTGLIYAIYDIRCTTYGRGFTYTIFFLCYYEHKLLCFLRSLLGA